MFFSLLLDEFLPWKLSQVKFLRELQIIVHFLPYHVLHIELKPLQSKYQNLWKVLYEGSLHSRCLLPQFLTKYLIVKNLRPKKVHKGLVEILLTLDIKRNVIKVFLFVFVEGFASIFLRKESQLLGITSSENRVD